MSLSAAFVDELRGAVGLEHVVTEPEQLRVYECDGLTGHRAIPEVVVLPGSTEEVQAVLRACHREHVPFVARGAGTGLSGGATPTAGGVVVSLARMDRILEIDLEGQRVVVEPGVANLDVTRAVSAEGFFYAPDPSSQQVCTVGGNVAENSGGAHCLKHGFTVHHVTGLTLVLPDGDVVELGGAALDPDGPDLLGLVVGSEGTLGIATRITLRVVRAPEVARVDGGDGLGRQRPAHPARLPAPRVVELDVQLALDACIHVPGRLTMPNGNDAGGFHNHPLYEPDEETVSEELRNVISRRDVCPPGAAPAAGSGSR